MKRPTTALDERTSGIDDNHNLEDDCCTMTPDTEWYRARDHDEELLPLARNYSGPRDLDCLDAFGASGQVAAEWKNRGRNAVSYDIKRHGRKNDITSRKGVHAFLNLGLHCKMGALIMGGRLASCIYS